MSSLEPVVYLAINPGLIALGLTVVGSILGAIFRKAPDDQVTEGPRLTGTREQTESTWGISKTIGFGVGEQLTGNIDFAGPIVEEVIVDKETISTGGFFGLFAKEFDVVNRTFLYRQTVGVSIAEVEFPNSAAANGRKARLLGITVNNESWFNATSTGDDFLRPGFTFVWFNGGQDQQPWADEQAITSGADRENVARSAPAYRGTCRAGFPDFLLDDTGRQFPANLLFTVDFTGGTPKLPSTIYLTSNLPDQARYDPVRRLLYAYDETANIYKIDLTSNTLAATWVSTDDQINGGEAIGIDSQGYIYLGKSGAGSTGEVSQRDPITGTKGITTLDIHKVHRAAEPADMLQFGEAGQLLLVVSGSTGGTKVLVYARNINNPTDNGSMMPIWNEFGTTMEETSIPSDGWSARWRRNPRDAAAAASTVEWWVASDNPLSANSPIQLTRVVVRGYVPQNAENLQAVLGFFGFDGTPVVFTWQVESANLADQIPTALQDQPHLCYVADDDTFLVVANGTLLKLQPPSFGGASLEWELLGTLTATDLGFPAPRTVADSVSSLISYPGTGLIAITSTDNDYLALVDPVAFELALRPGTQDAATYEAAADLGLGGNDFSHAVYDGVSHSVVLRNENTDYRRIFLDRADGATADLADIHHALSTRGPDWDVAGPGLRSSWNGAAHTDADDQIDVAALVGTAVRGYTIRDATTGKGAVEQLAEFYPTATGYYSVESDFKVISIPFGGAPTFALTEDDLLVGSPDEDPFKEVSLAEREFPRRVIVTTQGSDVKGERIAAPEKRYFSPLGSVLTHDDKRKDFSVLADASERKTVARRIMARAHSEERAIEWKHSPRFLAIDAGDSGTITAKGVTTTVRVGTPSIGFDFAVECKGVTEDRESYLLPAGTGASVGGFYPVGTLRPIVTDFALIDVPVPPGVVSPGIYILPLVTVSTWAGATFQRSTDGFQWESVAAADTAPTWGRASLLADAPAGLDLVNTVDITVPAGLNTAPAGTGFARVTHALTNGGFETGDLTGWTENLSPGFTNWQVLTSFSGSNSFNPAEGTYFVGANVDNVADAELYQDIDAVTAGVPAADFDADLVDVVIGWRQNSNAAGDDTGGVRIEFYDGDPTTTGVLLEERTSPMRSSADGTWLVLELRAHAPVNTRYYRLLLVGSGTKVGSAVSIFYDQVTLESLELGSLFQSYTIEEMLAGQGAIVIGREQLAYGDWEYLGSNVYRLSTLLRGLYCTDDATSTHIANELAFLPDERVPRASLPITALGEVSYYRAISVESSATSNVQSHVYQGRDLLSCAPAGLEAFRAPWHGDVLVRWDAETLGVSFAVELLHKDTGAVVRTYTVGRAAIEITGTEASTVDFEHMTVATVTHVSGAIGNGDFETGDTTGWDPTHTPAALDVDTLAPRQSVGNHAPYEGTYLLRLDGTTSDSIAGIERVIDLVGDGVGAFDLDNGFAMIEVRWRQAGFNATRDPVRCEVEWLSNPSTFLQGTFELDKTFIKSGFHAGTVSTANFGTTTPGKRLLLETATLAEARGTFMRVATAPSGGALTVDIERAGSAIAQWSVADGALVATLTNASEDIISVGQTVQLDGVNIFGAADLTYQIAFRDLEVYIRSITSAQTLPKDLPGASATATVAPSGGSVTYAIRKNGTQVGTIVFASGSTTATFTMASNTSLALGDRLTITAPANLRSMSGVTFALPTLVQGSVLKAEASPTLSVAPDVWTLRTFNSRSVLGARFARVRLIGVEVNTSDPSPSVDAFLDDVQIETVDAGIWRTLREVGETADFTPLIPGQLLYQTDPDGPNAGTFELVSVTIPGSGDAIEMFHYIDPAAGTVDDTVGAEEGEWFMYGEQVRIPLADIQAAGYTRGDSITIAVYELRGTRRGRPLSGTV